MTCQFCTNIDNAIFYESNLSRAIYNIKPIVKAVSTREQLMNELMSSGVKMIPASLQINSGIANTLGIVHEQASIITTFNDPKGHYAYCPMCFINN